MSRTVQEQAEWVLGHIDPRSPEDHIRRTLVQAQQGVNAEDVHEFYVCLLVKLDQQEKEADAETETAVSYWCQSGSADPKLADFCDNEVLAERRGAAKACREIEAIRKIVRDLQNA